MNFNFSSYEIVLMLVFMIIFFLMSFSKNNKIFFAESIILLGILAFFFNPVNAYIKNGNYTDLYRYFHDMDVIYEKGMIEGKLFLKTDYSVIPVMGFLVSMIAKTHIYNLLPVVVCIIFYSCIAKVFSKMQEKFNISRLNMAFYFFVFILITNFQSTITNIRTPLGFALFFLILYYDLIEGKGFKKCFIPYILLIGIHPFFIIFLIFRLFLNFDKKYSKKIICLFVLLYGVFYLGFLEIIKNFSYIPYVNFLLRKMDFYTDGRGDVYIDIPNLIVNLGILISLIIFMVRSKKYIVLDSNLEKSLNKFYDFSKIIVLFSIGSIVNLTFFTRVAILSTNLLVFWFIVYNRVTNQQTKEKTRILLPNFIFYVVLVMQVGLLFMGYQYQILCF